MTTNNKKVILEFPAELVNMTIKPEFEGVDKNGDPTIYRLISGTKEIIKENQKTTKPKPVFLKIAWTRQEFEKHEAEFILAKGFKGVKVYDPQAEHKANIEMITKVNDVNSKIIGLDATKTKVIGFQVYGKEALKDDINLVKTKLIAKATEDVNSVDKILSLNENNDRVLATTALVLNIIKEADAGNSVKFSDNDELIVAVRKGERLLDALDEHFKTNEGKEHKKRIGLKMQDKIPTEKTVEEEVLEKHTAKTTSKK